jgi:hypothetical protein
MIEITAKSFNWYLATYINRSMNNILEGRNGKILCKERRIVEYY